MVWSKLQSMAVKGGDEKRRRFEQEALPHLDQLHTAALYLTRSSEEAEDLLQETVLRAFRFFHQYAAGTNCRAWLLTILYNTFRNRYRRNLREQPAASVEDFERRLEAARLGDEPDNPEALLLDRVLDHDVQGALKSLPEDFRQVLLLVDVEELSYREAAAIAKVPIGTVRSRISRGRAMLRRSLYDLGRAKGYLRS